MKEKALEYAKRGWRVFPLHGVVDGKCTCKNPACSSPGKHPIPSNGLDAATDSAAMIEDWWRRWPFANIAIATGVFSGLVVLDIDEAVAHAEIKQRGEELPETLLVKTGKGEHYYFQHPNLDIRNFSRKIKGADLRGDRGYVVAPPSVHISGKIYEFEDEDAEVAPMPQWLIEIAQAKTPARSKATRSGVIPDGERNETLFKIGCRYRGEGFEVDDIEMMLLATNRKRCEPPLPEADILKIAESAAKYRPNMMPNLDAPEWMLEVQREQLLAAGAAPATVERVEKDLKVAIAEKAKEYAEGDLEIKVIRRTAGRGFGGVFDLIVYYQGKALPFKGIDPSTLINYDRIRVAALGEGVLLPDGPGAKKRWKKRLEIALDEGQIKQEARDPEEDPLTACILYARRWILDLHDPVETADEMAENTYRSAVAIPNSSEIGFSGESLQNFLRIHVPDAKRGHISGALKFLGASGIYTPKVAGGRRIRLRRVDVEAMPDVDQVEALSEENSRDEKK